MLSCKVWAEDLWLTLVLGLYCVVMYCVYRVGFVFSFTLWLCCNFTLCECIIVWFLCRLNECSWRHIVIQILYVCASVRPLKFWLTFFKLLLFEQVCFNYNQTWIIGALWEPSHYDARGGHMTRSKVIWGQIVIVISVNLFQIAPVRTGSLQLQPNLVHRCTMGTFSLWRSSRSHDKVKGHHWRSNCYSYFS